MDKLLKQIIKFGFVGGSAFVIDYGILFALTEFCGMNYLLSGMFSFSVSVIYNYICSIYWVFDVDRNKERGRKFFIFIALSVVGLGINQLLMWFLVEKCAIYYMVAKLAATFVVMVFNFVTRKCFLEERNVEKAS